MIGYTGFDFIIIDSEHGPFNPQTTMAYIQSATLHGITPLVRVQDHSRASILKMLDMKSLILQEESGIEYPVFYK